MTQSQPTSPAPAPKTSGLAIAGLVVGVGGLCTCGVGGIAGLVLSLVALKKIDASGGTLGGRGLAIAGIIASAVCILLGLIIGLGVLGFFFFAAAKTEAYNSELESDWDTDPDWSTPAPSPGVLLPPGVALILQRYLNAEIAESAEITSSSTTPARRGTACTGLGQALFRSSNFTPSPYSFCPFDSRSLRSRRSLR